MNRVANPSLRLAVAILTTLVAIAMSPAVDRPGTSVAAASYVEGIDVSHWQDSIDWPRVYAAGKRFAFIKATQGQSFLDSQYATNHANARAAGIRTTAYHFASPDGTPGDAVKEADWFVANANLLPGDLFPALDLEQAGGLGTTALQNWVKAWLGEVSKKLGGVKAMIYTSPAFWKKYLGDTSMFADAGYSVLWVAHWDAATPWVPGNGWGGRGWTFWQYDNCGHVSGISGCVDLDHYHYSDMTAVTYRPDFSLAHSPATATVKQGATATIGIPIKRKYFTLPIDLTVSGQPAGTTATVTPTTVTGSQATLSVVTSNTGTVTPVGTYKLTVTGTSGDYVRATTATLVVTDGIAPIANAPGSRLYSVATLGSTSAPARTTWSGSDAGGIGRYTLQRRTNGGSWSTVSLSSSTSTAINQSLTRGYTYQYRVRPTDRAGNIGAWVEGPAFVPMIYEQTSTAIAYTGSWPSTRNDDATGDHIRYTTSKNASATFTFNGSSVAWVAWRGPSRGSAAVYVDGAYRGTINLHSTKNHARQVVYAASWASNGKHTIKVVCLGTSGHPRIDVDAFVRLALIP